MKKKHHHKRKGHRNNGSGGGGSASHPRPRPRTYAPRLPRRAPPPDWKTIVAAIAGGGVSAALGGLIVKQQILPPGVVGLVLWVCGGATAYLSDGAARVVGSSVAAVGAGQFALALMAKQAVKSAANQNAAQQQAARQPAAQLPAPPPPAPPPRQSANEGGVVLDLFRDAATDLDMIDDQWRFGMRDDPRDAADPFVIDLDEAA